jgi:hypothetical protein
VPELQTIIWSFVVGAFGFYVTFFIGQPVRSFYELRREACQRLLSVESLSTKIKRDKNIGAYNHDAKIRFTDELANERGIFHELGARLIAFNEADWAAAKLVRLRFKPGEAGKAFIAMSETQDEKSLPEFIEKIKSALRFST